MRKGKINWVQWLPSTTSNSITFNIGRFESGSRFHHNVSVASERRMRRLVQAYSREGHGHFLLPDREDHSWVWAM